MNTSTKNLYKKPVITKSGNTIGVIHDWIIDIEMFGITHIEVKRGRIWNSEILLIHISHVIAIKKDSIVVDDSYVPLNQKKQHIAGALLDCVIPATNKRYGDS